MTDVRLNPTSLCALLSGWLVTLPICPELADGKRTPDYNSQNRLRKAALQGSEGTWFPQVHNQMSPRAARRRESVEFPRDIIAHPMGNRLPPIPLTLVDFVARRGNATQGRLWQGI